MNYGPVGPLKSWLDRVLELAVVLVIIGLLLNWAWQLIRPLLPVLALVGAVSAMVSYLVHRQRSW